MKRSHILVVAAVLVALLVLAVQPVSSVLSVEIDARVLRNDGLLVSVDYEVSDSSYLYEMAISIMPTSGATVLPGIIILDVSGSEITPPAVSGLYDHLTTELHLRGAEANVTIVDIGEVSEHLNDTEAIMIIGERSTMDNSTARELMDWVSRGGRLICIGPDSLPFRQEIHDGEWDGPDDFLRVKYRPLNYSGEEGMSASPYAEALSLRSVAPINAIEQEYLDNLSAVSIGYSFEREEGNLTTSAMVPLGEGRLVLFGGGMRWPAMTSGDQAFCWDIIQLYLGGAFWSVGAPEHTVLPMTKDARVGSFSATLSDAPAVVVMAYSLRDYVPAYGRAVATAS